MPLNNENTKVPRHWSVTASGVQDEMYRTSVTNAVMPKENLRCSKEAVWCGKHQEYTWCF